MFVSQRAIPRLQGACWALFAALSIQLRDVASDGTSPLNVGTGVPQAMAPLAEGLNPLTRIQAIAQHMQDLQRHSTSLPDLSGTVNESQAPNFLHAGEEPATAVATVAAPTLPPVAGGAYPVPITPTAAAATVAAPAQQAAAPTAQSVVTGTYTAPPAATPAVVSAAPQPVAAPGSSLPAVAAPLVVPAAAPTAAAAGGQAPAAAQVAPAATASAVPVQPVEKGTTDASVAPAADPTAVQSPVPVAAPAAASVTAAQLPAAAQAAAPSPTTSAANAPLSVGTVLPIQNAAPLAAGATLPATALTPSASLPATQSAATAANSAASPSEAAAAQGAAAAEAAAAQAAAEGAAVPGAAAAQAAAAAAEAAQAATAQAAVTQGVIAQVTDAAQRQFAQPDLVTGGNQITIKRVDVRYDSDVCLDQCSCWPVWAMSIVVFCFYLAITFIAFYMTASLYSQQGLGASNFYRGGGNWLLAAGAAGLLIGGLVGGLVPPSCWAGALYLGGAMMSLLVATVLVGRRGAWLGALGGLGSGGVIGVFTFVSLGVGGIVVSTVMGLLLGIVLGFAPIFRSLKINERYICAGLRSRSSASHGASEERNRSYEGSQTMAPSPMTSRRQRAAPKLSQGSHRFHSAGQPSDTEDGSRKNNAENLEGQNP
ncbi:hypothetical protein Efla_000420 [Eimeria flavescens]